MQRLSEISLEAGPVVANCQMNRERGLTSYSTELRVCLTDLLSSWERPRWLDLCCGHGNALADASLLFPHGAFWGVDLVDTFVSAPPVEFTVSSLRSWTQPQAVDLITCVHGLHYVGDKLGAITRASTWLAPEGWLLAHLDLSSLYWHDGKSASRAVSAWLRGTGWSYHRKHRLLSRRGPSVLWPATFAGADATAGPNYTGQSAVDGYYHRLATQRGHNEKAPFSRGPSSSFP